MTQIKAFKNYEQLLNHFNQLNATIEQLTLDKQKLTTMVAETQVENLQLKSEKEKLEDSNKQLVVNNQQMLNELQSFKSKEQQYLTQISQMQNTLKSIHLEITKREDYHNKNIEENSKELLLVRSKLSQLIVDYNSLINSYNAQNDLLLRFKRHFC